MNNLIIYVDDRKVENNETKYRCLVKTEKETLEVYLTQKSIDKLKQSDKFNIESKTFTDKILDDLNNIKPCLE